MRCGELEFEIADLRFEIRVRVVLLAAVFGMERVVGRKVPGRHFLERLLTGFAGPALLVVGASAFVEVPLALDVGVLE